MDTHHGHRNTMRPALATVIVMCVLALAGGDRYHPERAERGAGGAGGTGARQYVVPDVDPRERTAGYWYEEAARGLAARETRRAHTLEDKAKNVVMFLGDGMSVPTLAAARTLLGQREGRPGEEAELSFEKFPTVGLVKTYCVNDQIPDSACTATAYLSGIKCNRGTLGVTAAVPRGDCDAYLDAGTHVQSIAEWALAAGRDVGIVTTTRITHASPAGAYAKTANRNWEDDSEVRAVGHDPERCPDIAHQLVHHYPGNQFKVILGGGRRNFIPNTIRDEEGTRGRREDERNLIQEWQDDKAARNVSYKYVWHRDELMAAAADPPEFLLGLFEGTHMQYHLEADPVSEPTLTELTEIAIRSLSRNENGFFLFVESGRIDHAHHDNWPVLALDETIQMSHAAQRATELLSEEDSLIVVTADHAHVMAFNGYTRRGGDILGPSDDVGDDGVPYMTLSYTNGPGARVHVGEVRPNVLADDNYRELRWYTHSEVILESETHGGDDVGVFAWGPQHAMFSGLYEQSQIPHLMAYASCLGPGARAQACSAAAALRLTPLALLLAAMSVFRALLR